MQPKQEIIINLEEPKKLRKRDLVLNRDEAKIVTIGLAPARAETNAEAAACLSEFSE